MRFPALALRVILTGTTMAAALVPVTAYADCTTVYNEGHCNSGTCVYNGPNATCDGGTCVDNTSHCGQGCTAVVNYNSCGPSPSRQRTRPSARPCSASMRRSGPISRPSGATARRTRP
jgi:hypothetical protein